jgi:hypothetical protein
MVPTSVKIFHFYIFDMPWLFLFYNVLKLIFSLQCFLKFIVVVV